MTRRRAAIALIFAGAALAVCGALWNARPHLAYRADDPSYNQAYWAQEIASKGGKAAYQEYLARAKELPPARQHLAAHAMGNAIGQALGPAGISVCDPSFGYGCYHGLFAEVIGAGGLGRVPELDAACQKAYGKWVTGCTHGIGHGILEYVGYGKVNDALALCKETTQPAPLMGCTSGVFMEYFFPLVGAGGALQPSTRVLDPAAPYAPCPEAPVENRSSCYFEYGQYLQAAEAGARANALCDAAPAEGRRYCFLGLGAMRVLTSDYDMQASLATCVAYADSADCRSGVWWSFYADPAHRAQDDQACAYASAAETQACRVFGDLDGMAVGKNGV